MYKTCATEESARRQRQLENCLLELMLITDYGSITVSHICDRAGIARKSFYRYFSSKDGCLQALIDHAVFDGASYYMPGFQDDQAIQLLFERFFFYWKEKHLLLEALVRNDLAAQLFDRMRNYIILEEHEFQVIQNRRIPDARERSIFYISGIISLLLYWHQSGYQKSIPHMAQILSELVI